VLYISIYIYIYSCYLYVCLWCLGGADPQLGVEMASTGEVACFGTSKHEAFLKALISSNFKMPKKNVLVSTQFKHRDDFVHLTHKLNELGFNLHATADTHEFLKAHEVETKLLDTPKKTEAENDADDNVMHYLKEGKIDLVINLHTSDPQEAENNYTIRRTAADFSIPLLTNLPLTELFVESMDIHHQQPFLGLEAGSLFDYYANEPVEEAWTAPTEFH